MSAKLDSERVYEVLRTVLDPELGVNVVDLGLVYSVEVTPEGVFVAMTMTTAACPLGEHLRETAHAAVSRLAGAEIPVDVRLVWDPPWSPSMMSEQAKSMLGHS